MTSSPLRRVPAHDGTLYRDLNGNGVMDPYEDPRLPVAERVEDLLGRLSLDEKAGLMFHPPTSVSPDGSIDTGPRRRNRASVRELVEERRITHLNLHELADPATTARWVNAVQALAEQAPHGIPVTFSTDPRHSFVENVGASFQARHFSAWPEPIGFGALADEDAVREFATIARREYLALGIRAALHPTLDLATEPRWGRQYSTFGDDAELAGRLGVAYLDGFEGAELGAESVSCIAKHFPGGGPQLDGEDPHFPYGREQVYPGGMAEYHLEPFRRVIERGVTGIMPYYGIPIGLEIDGEPIEEVGFGFNRQIVTGLLRERLGFDGVVCTDWGLITDSWMDRPLPARAWGVEHLDALGRARKVLDAGCDQFGGEDDPGLVVRLVQAGAIDESRIDESVRRLLTVKFRLGLFDDPYVDESGAGARLGTPEHRAAGLRAQARSAVVLKSSAVGGSEVLPVRVGARVFSAEIDDAVLVAAGLVPVAEPRGADVVVMRIDAPFEPRDRYMLESSFHAGSLEFPAETVHRVAELAAHAPVILAVHLDRPAILTPLEPHASAIVGVFGAQDDALLDVLTGRVNPAGRLPFQLPRTPESVLAGRPDVPGDLMEPLFDRERREAD